MKIKNVNKKIKGTGEITMEYAEKTFNELLAFQGYGFCLGYDTKVEKENGEKINISELRIGDYIKIPEYNNKNYAEVIDILPNGEKDAFEIELENGNKIITTMEHLYLCDDNKKHTMLEIIEKKLAIVCE